MKKVWVISTTTVFVCPNMETHYIFLKRVNKYPYEHQNKKNIFTYCYLSMSKKETAALFRYFDLWMKCSKLIWNKFLNCNNCQGNVTDMLKMNQLREITVVFQATLTVCVFHLVNKGDNFIESSRYLEIHKGHQYNNCMSIAWSSYITRKVSKLDNCLPYTSYTKGDDCVVVI